MKKHTKLFFILLIAATLFYSENLTELFHDEFSNKKHISGAYEALNFLGARQRYPYKTIPRNAHYAAWEKWNNESGGDQRKTTPPWETLGPHNRGGRTLAIAMNPQNENSLFAGSASGGLWKSTSGGKGAKAWEYVETGFPVLGVSTIAIHPTDSMIMYIGTGEVYNYEAAGTGAGYRNTRGSYGMGILKSEDGGKTWFKSLDWSYNQQHGIWMIKINPQNPNIIYVATTNGIYKSVDAGLNWEQSLNVVMGNDLVIHPGNPNLILAACGNFESPGYGIYKSWNAGETWEKIGSDLPQSFRGKIQLGIAPSNQDIVYASIGDGFTTDMGASWLCRSEDFGSTWEVRTTEDYSRWQGWFSHDVAVSPIDADVITAIGINVWNSSDGGYNITRITNGGGGYANPPIEGSDGNFDYVHSDAHDVLYNPNNPLNIYVANDGGIHRTDDGGSTWYSINGGYQTTQFYNGTSTSQNDPDFYMGGLQDNGTIRWNGDLTWRRIWGGDGSWSAIHPDDDNVFFVSSQFLNVRKTINGGNNFFGMNWGDTYNGSSAFIAPYVIAPSDGNILYAGTRNIAGSQDEAVTWTTLNGGQMLDGNPILSMEVSPQDPAVLYVGKAPSGGNRGHIFSTTDGSTFKDVTFGLPDRYPMDITVDPTNPAKAYVVFSGFGTGHIYRTYDYGDTWEDITNNLPDVPTNVVIVDPVFPDHIYVGNDLGVFVSTDGGNIWESYQDGLSTAVMVFDLEIYEEERKLRAATHGNGAFQRDLLDAPVSSLSSEVIENNLNLYPNPATNLITVQIEGITTQSYDISIQNIHGNIVDQIKKADVHSMNPNFDIDITDLLQGTYFVTIQCDANTMTRKFIKL
jgi:photosystem II stability/assembly factor-like uncharacterized protein